MSEPPKNLDSVNYFKPWFAPGRLPLAPQKAYYLQRTRFERIAERKLRHRVLTEDGVETTGRDLRELHEASKWTGLRSLHAIRDRHNRIG